MLQTLQEVPKTDSSPIYASLVSQVPGRVRLRVAHPHRYHQEIQEVAKALKESLEMYRVRANVESGSITIFYSKEYSSFEDVCAKLRELGTILRECPQEKSYRSSEKSQAALGIASAVMGINQRVQQVTDGKVDLRFLLPLGFGTLAVRQLLSKGLLLEEIPWYVLAWYAFDSFIKLHASTEPQSQSDHSP